MQVFLSSTIYDLLDVRSELADLLRRLDVMPLLSDDKLSDFRVQQSMNSIETCLVNVATADEFIIVLSERYGPSLSKAGYDDISATHLEYRRAVQLNKPVHMFVRDRLEADYSIWKKNGRREDVGIMWVKKPDFGLFSLLDEHTRLIKEAVSTNWYTTFSTSVDLKAAVTKRLEGMVLPIRLTEAIASNRFPVFNILVSSELGHVDNHEAIICSVQLTNVGGGTAFNCTLYWDDDLQAVADNEIVSPSSSINLQIFYDISVHREDISKVLVARYSSPIGVTVEERFAVTCNVGTGGRPLLHSSAARQSRVYRRESQANLQVQCE
jgi:hypothetical protein